MVFKVFVQEKVRSTGRLVEVACFSRCPARFFASFPALSKPKIEGKQRNLPLAGKLMPCRRPFDEFRLLDLVNLVNFGEFW